MKMMMMTIMMTMMYLATNNCNPSSPQWPSQSTKLNQNFFLVVFFPHKKSFLHLWTTCAEQMDFLRPQSSSACCQVFCFWSHRFLPPRCPHCPWCLCLWTPTLSVALHQQWEMSNYTGCFLKRETNNRRLSWTRFSGLENPFISCDNYLRIIHHYSISTCVLIWTQPGPCHHNNTKHWLCCHHGDESRTQWWRTQERGYKEKDAVWTNAQVVKAKLMCLNSLTISQKSRALRPRCVDHQMWATYRLSIISEGRDLMQC